VDPFLTLNLRLLDNPPVEVKTGLVGGYNLSNILAAVALGMHFRIQPANILSTLDGWSSRNNRSQRIETESNILILDAYNANPTSMMAALESFDEQDHPRKTLILGDMLELGEDEVESHREVLDYVTGMSCEEIFLVGKIFSSLPVKKDIRIFHSAEELDAWLAGNPMKGMLILLKGSRGIGLERVKDRL
jgi:UDP-N-acetylmuramoyl-tripeptide--D-alanyl-D-alanine ligase